MRSPIILAALLILAAAPLRAEDPTDGHAVTVGNPLFLRYQMVLPEITHVIVGEGADAKAWTTYMDDNRLKIVFGKVWEAQRTYAISGDDLAKIKGWVGDNAITFAEKLEMMEFYAGVCQVPSNPAPNAEQITGIRLTGWERSLLHMAYLSENFVKSLGKAAGTTNKIHQIYWGLRAKIFGIRLDSAVDSAVEAMWEDIDAALDRTDEQLVPGSKFDLVFSVAGIHICTKSLNISAYMNLVKRTVERLNAEMLSLPDYPPGVKERREKTIKLYLEPAKKLLELIEFS